MEEMVVAENMSQQLMFLVIELVVIFIAFLIGYWFYKYGRKYEILNKFVSMPIVQNILIDIQYILTNYLKLKTKQKMKEKKIGEKSEVDEIIPPELIKKYGEQVRTLSKESLQRLKEIEEKKDLEKNNT